MNLKVSSATTHLDKLSVSKKLVREIDFKRFAPAQRNG